MAKVYVRPLRSFYDDDAGVQRLKTGGVFLTEEEYAEQWAEAGYIEYTNIPVPEEEVVEESPTEEDTLSDLSVEELREIAEEREIELPSTYVKKDDLINRLEEYADE